MPTGCCHGENCLNSPSGYTVVWGLLFPAGSKYAQIYVPDYGRASLLHANGVFKPSHPPAGGGWGGQCVSFGNVRVHLKRT